MEDTDMVIAITLMEVAMVAVIILRKRKKVSYLNLKVFSVDNNTEYFKIKNYSFLSS